MKVDIVVPAMGESITEAIVGSIIKSTGIQVAMDEEILELETDKVNQVLYAPKGGMVHWTVEVDDTVTIGQTIGYVDTEANGSAAPPAAAPTTAPAVEQPAPPPPAAPEVTAPQDFPGVSTRFTKEAYLEEVCRGPEAPPALTTPAPAAPAQAAPAPQPKGGEQETRRRMPRIRQVIAERLVQAQQTTAMLTTFNEVDMSQVMQTRQELKDSFLDVHGIKLGFMSFFVKACVSALKAFPDINSYIDGTDIVRREYYHVGIAVGTERGLVVPVLRNCDEMSFADVERSIREYALQARDGKLALQDLEGGGFTVTNGGIYGSMLSTPILNPPQSGILGMHSINKRAVVVDDQIVVRPMMYLALSYDHRIVDGKEAVSFLVHVKNCIEDPKRLLLEIG